MASGSLSTCLTLLNLNLFLSSLIFLLTFSITMLIHCVKHLTYTHTFALIRNSKREKAELFFVKLLKSPRTPQKKCMDLFTRIEE